MLSEKYKDFDRVSSVLAPFSGYDAIPADILQKAADRGTLIHKAIHQKVLGVDEWSEVPERFAGYMQSFNRFWEKNETEKMACEVRYGHEDLRYTGQVDYLCIYKGKICLMDWKTSSKPNCTWSFQGAAYVEMLRSCGINVSSCLFIHLSKNGEYPEVYDFTLEHQQKFDTFKKCLELYRIFYKPKKIYDLED